MKLNPQVKAAAAYVDNLTKSIALKYKIPESEARKYVERASSYNVESEVDVHNLIKKWLKK